MKHKFCIVCFLLIVLLSGCVSQDISSKNDKTIDTRGTLNYDNGYKYDKGGLTYRVSPTGVWSDIDGGLILEKLKEESYEFRAYIIVPKVVA